MTDQNNQGAQGYSGQAGLGDDTSQYNVMTFIIRQMLARTRTMLPVKVMAVDTAARTVNVQPLVNQMDGVGNSTPHGTIFAIPYVELRGGSNAIALTPAIDDIGIMIVADRDISAVKASRDVANPGSFRRFNLADGVYLGGILANTDADQRVTLDDAGITFRDRNGNTIVMSSTGMVLTDKNSNVFTMSSTGINIADKNANQIQMVAGFVNIVTLALKVNGIPVTVP